MRIYLFFILFICLRIDSYAQHIINVQKYYAHAYKAESYIISNDMRKACTAYDSAFLYCSAPFSNDLYNQVVALLSLKDYEQVKRRSEQLILKGATLSFFNQSMFSDFRKTAYWNDLRNRYASLAAERHLDTGLIKQIQAMIEQDQKVHCQLPQHSGDTVFVKQMSELNDTLSQSLSELLLKHNYLDEEIIGAYFVDTMLSTQPFYWVLVLHEFQRHGVQLDSQIRQMIYKGKIKSETALSTMEMASRGIIFTSDFKVYNNQLYQYDRGDTNSKIFKLNAKYIKRLLTPAYDPEVIQLRAQYYIDQPGNIINKIKFCHCNTLSPFLFTISVNTTGNFRSKEDETDFFKTSKLIDCEFISIK